MTHLTTTDHTPRRPLSGLRRAATVGAIVAFGLLTPAAASAGPAGPPPGPGDVTSNPGCEPDLPCDVGPGPGDPDPDDDCHPFLATCDEIISGGGPDDPDPCEGDDPPASCDPGPGDEPQVPTGEVDVPVSATPNFTG